jgi:hypothetical protein
MGMLKKRHVHVYRVVSLYEIDALTTSDNEACREALDAVVKPGVSGFGRPDCKFIAIIPKEVCHGTR